MGIEEALGKILNWMGNNITLVVIIFTFVIQITPIKWSPWSSLIKWIAKLVNGESDKRIDSLITTTNGLQDEIKILQNNVDENEKDRIRWEILGFANSCRNGRKHTRDEFQHIITLNDKYKELLKKTKDANGVFEVEYEYIKKLYSRRLEKNDFLTSNGEHEPED